MMKYLEDILAAGSMGCVVRLAELISKHEKVEYQKKYIAALAETLHIPDTLTKENNPLSKLVLCMRTYDHFFKISETATATTEESSAAASAATAESKTENTENTENEESSTAIDEKSPEPVPPPPPVITNSDINYHGCCLLQNLFSFKKCRSIVESFLQLTPEELKAVACNPYGSFSLERFATSAHVPAKSKIILGEQLLSFTYELACDKFGSRVIDSVYKIVDDPTQERIKYILREHKSRLETNLYGRIVLYNCGVKQYVNTMREAQEQQQLKRKKMFEDILEGDSATKGKNVAAPVAAVAAPTPPPPKKKKGNLLNLIYSVSIFP